MNNFEGKRIFLAGSTGVVGTNLLKKLAQYDVAIKANYHKTPPIINDPKIEYVRGDSYCINNIDMSDCDIAILAAAYSGGAKFIKEKAWEHMKRNIVLNINLLEACQRHNVKRVIFIGSSVVYPEFEGSIKESEFDPNVDPSEVYFCYGHAMRFIENMCRYMFNKHGIESIVVRAANIYGPYDKFDPKVSHFIPALIRKATDKIDPYEVWGSPDVIRDVIYAEDFADAVITLMEQVKTGTFNIGAGTVSVSGVVETILQCTEHLPTVKYLQDKPTTIKFRALDCDKIHSLTRWKAKHSLQEGIKKTTDWWIKNKEDWKR